MGEPEAKPQTVWAPQDGSQTLFLACPHFECLYGGTRGPGKTDALLMDYAQHVGQFGKGWRGILFRRTYKQLDDVVAKTKRWFPQMFPSVRFNASDYRWRFKNGEELLLRHMDKPDDYWNYHGHEYPWIGWEELTNWPSLDCYEAMKSCCRSSHEGLHRKYRATCNPYGIGHNAVKRYFVDGGPQLAAKVDADGNALSYVILTPEGDGRTRAYIHGSIFENEILLKADPKYLANLEGITDENRRKAWLYGSWDITAGGALDDVWDRAVHVLRPFKIPHGWFVDRSFDWGSACPFSVGWWAESDGTAATLHDGSIRHWPRGTLFRIGEWYGGDPNADNTGINMNSHDIGRGIAEREKTLMEIYGIAYIAPGPADASIFDRIDDDSTANRVTVGYRAASGRHVTVFVPSNKAPGTRRRGLELLRTRLEASLEKPMEAPGLFIFDTCRDWLRTVPVLPRSEKDPEDVSTEAEDHAYDETRYRIIHQREVAFSQGVAL